eukprot:306390-Chlamydomonas_euryale.AAC.2
MCHWHLVSGQWSLAASHWLQSAIPNPSLGLHTKTRTDTMHIHAPKREAATVADEPGWPRRRGTTEWTMTGAVLQGAQ